MPRTELSAAPARRSTVTDNERDILLAQLNDYAGRPVVGAQAIIDEVELGARVADTFAMTPSR
jgi:hypothetical protein